MNELINEWPNAENGPNFQMISNPQEHEFISKPDSKALN